LKVKNIHINTGGPMKKLFIAFMFLSTLLSAQNLVDPQTTKDHYTPYKTSWYLGIGGTYPRYMTISSPLIAGHSNYGLNLSLGYNITEHIGLRLLGNLLSIDSYSNDRGSDNTSRVNMGTFNLEVVYTLLACDYLTPYFTAGYGYEIYKFDNPYIIPGRGEIRKDPDGLWDGYQLRLGGGLEYRMLNDLSIVTEINYTTASNNRIDGNDTRNEVKGILQSNGDSYMTVDLGIRWYFSRGDTSRICNAGGIREVEIIKEVPVETIIKDTVFVEKIVENGVRNKEAFVLDNIRFKFDQDKLTEESKLILDRVASVLKRFPEEKIEILGHTDNIGDDLYNMGLSERRAISVKNYLISKGVNGKNLYTAGCGERKPIATNETAAGRAINRRIEFSIYDGKTSGCPKFETPSDRNGVQLEKAIQNNDKFALEGVYFNHDSDILTTDSKDILLNAVEILKKHPNVNIEIHGHTDNNGDANYNKDLSLRRAISVKNFLIAHGINANRMTTFGHGEELPIADNNTSYGRARNRRIEFKLTGEKKSIQNESENTNSKNQNSETIELSPEAKIMEKALLNSDKFVLNNLHFVFDKDILVEKSKQILLDVTNVLKKHPNIKIRIEGHTDNIGTDDYNQYLSIMRANAVKRYLVEHGIYKSRLTTKGFGESSPIADNNTEKGRALNRRIEFKVIE
jgi:outer membrane protein OmpA-like peptidoglycan-associated protein